jgi:NADP-dependent 3-hydroxy acid dehydrogenase YdfG
VTVGSTAAFVVYEGGGGYTAAKHAQNALMGTLRLELAGKPVRVMEIDPGMVRTDEFALNRMGGDKAQADAVYEGVRSR